MSDRRHYKILILGGGSGGISVAARLRRKVAGAIAVVEPSADHYYQPLWTLVGAGLVDKEASSRPVASLIPKNVDWKRARVAKVDPVRREVLLAGGETLTYEILIVATGLEVDFARIPGMPARDFEKFGICSIYDYEGSERTAHLLQKFQGGRAIFTMPPVPIKCAGAPQKICYLADEMFRRNGVREKTDLVFATTGKTIFGIPVFAEALRQVVERKGIRPLYAHRLVEVRPERREAIFEVTAGEHPERIQLAYDLLHVVPPMHAHAYVRESGLAPDSGPQAGWLAVDPHTLRHLKYPDIYGIGDVTGVPNSKTGAAIRKQAPVVTANVLATLQGESPAARYDGYSSCPLVTGVGKVILAEFGYDGKLMPSFPIDATKERRSMWWLKRYLLPPMYWHGMMRGRL